MTVYCVKCHKEIEIKPDALGRLMPALLHWVGELGEKCNECLTVSASGDRVPSVAQNKEE